MEQSQSRFTGFAGHLLLIFNGATTNLVLAVVVYVCKGRRSFTFQTVMENKSSFVLSAIHSHGCRFENLLE